MKKKASIANSCFEYLARKLGTGFLVLLDVSFWQFQSFPSFLCWFNSQMINSLKWKSPKPKIQIDISNEAVIKNLLQKALINETISCESESELMSEDIGPVRVQTRVRVRVMSEFVSVSVHLCSLAFWCTLILTPPYR